MTWTEAEMKAMRRWAKPLLRDIVDYVAMKEATGDLEEVVIAIAAVTPRVVRAAVAAEMRRPTPQGYVGHAVVDAAIIDALERWAYGRSADRSDLLPPALAMLTSEERKRNGARP